MGQVVRHHPPRGPRTDDPAEAIEDLPQAMSPLRNKCSNVLSSCDTLRLWTMNLPSTRDLKC